MIISITGHRPEKLSINNHKPYPLPDHTGGGYSFSRLIDLFFASFKRYEPDKVISGMALGADMAAAQAAVYADIPFLAAVPFEGQEGNWPESSQQYYRMLLEKASNVEYTCPPGYAAWKMQKRNQWMVDNSNMVLALWDGTTGGTDNCVRYAREQSKPIVNLWEFWDKYKDARFQFSNFHESPIEYEGIVYPTVENFYQAMKTEEPLMREMIARMNPEEARASGRGLTLRNEWDTIREGVMEYGLRLKFEIEEHKQELLSTYPKPLIEWTSWGDNFWGVDKLTGQGENKLGKLLETIREELYHDS